MDRWDTAERFRGHVHLKYFQKKEICLYQALVPSSSVVKRISVCLSARHVRALNMFKRIVDAKLMGVLILLLYNKIWSHQAICFCDISFELSALRPWTLSHEILVVSVSDSCRLCWISWRPSGHWFFKYLSTKKQQNKKMIINRTSAIGPKLWWL